VKARGEIQGGKPKKVREMLSVKGRKRLPIKKEEKGIFRLLRSGGGSSGEEELIPRRGKVGIKKILGRGNINEKEGG